MSTIEERLRQALDAAASGSGGPVAVEGEGWTAQVQTEQVGPVGVVVDHLRVQGRPGDVAERAEAVVEALRPGGERLRAVEVDRGLGGAVLRTRERDMRGGRYFEVELGPEEAVVRRHRVRKGEGRTAEPYALTREELGRIVEDLGEVLARGGGGEDDEG